MDNILELAKKLLENHKNPIRRFELPGNKVFIPKATQEELDLISCGLCSIKQALDQERVERRCARVTAYWLSDKNLARLAKGGKILNLYGFVNKSERFLYPEETLLLLETNRIELVIDKIPVTILEAYDILTGSHFDISKYIAYRKLSIQGFRLLRHINVFESVASKRRRLEMESPTVSKISQNPDKTTKEASSSVEIINDIFRNLQEKGPKCCLPILPQATCDYKVFLPDNINKIGHDFNLHISDSQYIDPKFGFLNTSIPNIVNFISPEFSGYFQISQVNLPTL